MYAITGASGHTGNIVARRLLADRQKVRVIGRDQQRLHALTQNGAEPYVTNLNDTAGLAKAFAGCEAVYLMIPPDSTTKNYRAFQDRVTDAFASALAVAGVKFAVALSSVGADKAGKTGPVVGLHNLEKRLSTIDGLNVLFLRAGYFMENTLPQADVIHAMDKVAGPIRLDLKMPMIASRDIGNAVADALLRYDFVGRQTRELLGQRDITYGEVARIIGQALGKPDLAYTQVPDNEFRVTMLNMGMSSNMVNLILEMTAAMNSGHMCALEPRSAANTTATSYESFVAEEFVPAFEGHMAHA